MMNRTVVVTGVTSFVGYHLANAFIRAGWRVIAVHSRLLGQYENIRQERLQNLDAGIELRRLDLRNSSDLTDMARDIAPNLWVQHAGYAENYGSLDYDLTAAAAVNVAPLAPLFAALGQKSCGVIVTGSSAEYSSSDHANREDDACWPDTPYGVAKLTETLIARQLALQYGVPTRVARVYIPFGAMDNPSKLLSAVTTALRAGHAIDLSPCEQQRDFVAVEDLVQGYLALAEDFGRRTFDVFNLSSGRAVPLRSLLLAMAELAGQPASLLRFGVKPMRQGEPAISFGDIQKAQTLLHWYPRPAEKAIVDLVCPRG
jgi:nucleoside-diphosphate-sugar epimerase